MLMGQGIAVVVSLGMLFASMPSSTNYDLHNYSFGSGGTSNSSSSSYNLNGTSGETSNVQSTSSNYKVRSGNNNSQQANVPNAPTFTNPSSYYDKLSFVVNPGGTSASDYKYSIAISSDGFTTTQYVQVDDTVGSTPAFQTYSAWGGASGQLVIGLTYSTTYSMKVNAMQGNFTETEYGPTTTASTVAPNITFDLYTDSQPTPPFSTNFGNLLPATVATASDKIWIGLTTNADSGGTVYVNSMNGGLHSNTVSATIASATADLSSVGSGYGAQVVSTAQTSGGPLASLPPYNGSANNVGALSTLLTRLYSTAAPITSGSASFKLMAKAAALTPASGDYADTLTLTCAGTF